MERKKILKGHIGVYTGSRECRPTQVHQYSTKENLASKQKGKRQGVRRSENRNKNTSHIQCTQHHAPCTLNHFSGASSPRERPKKQRTGPAERRRTRPAESEVARQRGSYAARLLSNEAASERGSRRARVIIMITVSPSLSRGCET